MDHKNKLQGIEEHLALSIMMMAVCCYLMFAPVWFPQVTGRIYDNARVLQLFLVILLVPLSLFPDARAALVASWTALGRAARACIAILLGGGFLSAAFSSAPQVGFLQVGLVALLIWLFLCTCAIVRKLGRPAETVLAVAVCVGAGLAVVHFCATFLQCLEAGRQFSWISPFLEFANVRFFGQYQAYALLLVAVPAGFLKLSASWRIVVYLAAASFWSLQWMVGSRAVWVGFIAAVVAISFCMRQGRLRWLATQVALVLAGGAIYLLFASFVLSNPNATSIPAANSVVGRGGESTSERVTMAKAALQLTVKHPLLGTGPGQFGLHFSATGAAHPHDTPLQLISEYGLPAGLAGVALGGMLLAFAMRELRTRTRSQPDVVGAGLAAALVMGLVESLFSGNLVMPHSQAMLAVLAGWLVGRARVTEPPRVFYGNRMGIRRTALLGSAILACLVTAILSIEYLDVTRDLWLPSELRTPSFWQYARFSKW